MEELGQGALCDTAICNDSTTSTFYSSALLHLYRPQAYIREKFNPILGLSVYELSAKAVSFESIISNGGVPATQLRNSSQDSMAFTELPNAILGVIIPYTLPEGFEGLTLTCKHLHALCAPLIARHNKLRFYFRDFNYYRAEPGVNGNPYHVFLKFPYSMASAYNLIEQIAVEPIVTRYIQNANFDFDSSLKRKNKNRRVLKKDEGRTEAIAELLAISPYLEKAGLDWREYHNEIQTDVNRAKYSQRAAEFVLTLLPNLKTLQLPKYWSPTDETDKLVYAITERARQKPLSRGKTPSLAQLTKLNSSSFSKAMARYDFESHLMGFNLNWEIPFLSLPQVQSFCGPADVQGTRDLLINYPYNDSGMALEEVHLESASVDSIYIGNFLRHVPSLKKLRYSHCTSRYFPFRDWDICQFIAAIADGIGSHLTELSISINEEFSGTVVPGKPSMQGFQQLQTLGLPIEFAICALDSGVRSPASLLDTLVPASVSRLSLGPQKPDHGGMAIDVMFYKFSANKASKTPSLKEIYLPERFASLAPEVEKAGVTLHMI